MLSLTETAVAQTKTPNRAAKTTRPAAAKPAQQKEAAAPNNTITLTDSLTQRTDTLKVGAKKGDIETTINYSARDSIRFDVVNKIMYLYGDGKIDYGTTSLTAEQVQINWGTTTLYANGVPDSTGKLTGTPFFKDGTEQYEAERIAYNYKSKRGKISGAITKQGEGYMHAETIKRISEDVLYGQNAQYTTCDLKHPHYYINSHKMKVEPGRKVITGPFNLWIGDVPTPVGFLFGLFPTPKKRSSGIIIPSFGETRQDGFFLRDGGYYWAVNDYVGMKFLGNVYSLGGYGLTQNTEYRKRYHYSGNFTVRYNLLLDAEQNIDLDTAATVGAIRAIRPETRSVNIEWYHMPVALGDGGRFTANVRAGTRYFNRIRSTDPNVALAPSFNSTISYTRSIFDHKFDYTVTARQSQVSETGRMDFSLPDVTFSVNQFYPLRGLNKKPSGRWHEKFTDEFSLRYNFTGQNELTNYFAADAAAAAKEKKKYEPGSFFNGDNLKRIFDNAQIAANNVVGIGLGNYRILKYLNLSPTISYNEAWYLKSLNYKYNPILDTVEVDTVSGFTRLYNYSAGASLSTTFYGLYQIKGKKIEAIRHMVRPNVSYAYTPNFSDPSFGFYQNIQTKGIGTFGQFDRFASFPYNSITRQTSSRIGFGISNSLEMKVKTKEDTVSGFKKLSLLDNLSIGSGYNFAADSLNLDNFTVNLNTNLLNRINTSFTMLLDPYQFRNGDKINKYEFSETPFSPFRLTNASLSLSTDLNPESWKRKQEIKTNAQQSNQNPDLNPILDNLPDYVDFDIKWSLGLEYNVFYTNPKYQLNAQPFTQNLSVHGTVNPTSKWNIGYRTNYDFQAEQFTFTNLEITRDLHCWQMLITWTPFGTYQGYYVNINVKSAMLQDLKISRNRSYYNR